MAQPSAQTVVTILNERGLHARAAAKFSTIAPISDMTADSALQRVSSIRRSMAPIRLALLSICRCASSRYPSSSEAAP